jgi:hypothetical protein
VQPQQGHKTKMNTQAIETLVGKQATIFNYNDFGFPSATLCTIEKVYVKDYAQYSNLVHIVFRPKRKRTSFVVRIYDHSTIAIWEGHVNVDSNPWVETSTSENGVTVSKSLRCFSNGYMDRALASTTQKPVFLQVK